MGSQGYQQKLGRSILKEQIRNGSDRDVAEVQTREVDESPQWTKVDEKSWVHRAANSSSRRSLVNCLWSSMWKKEKVKGTERSAPLAHLCSPHPDLLHHTQTCSWLRKATLFVYMFEDNQGTATFASSAYTHQLWGPLHHTSSPRNEDHKHSEEFLPYHASSTSRRSPEYGKLEPVPSTIKRWAGF